MSNAGERGPQVNPTEDLYRLITTSDWWVADEKRPSSAAFDAPKFSVNIASLTTKEETARQLHDDLNRPKGGIVAFNCGQAREHGFDPRQELDDRFPENHAHVYYEGSKSSRKKNARHLVQLCRLILEPTF